MIDQLKLSGETEGKQVKLSPFLTKHHAWEVEVQLYAFLISALDGGE